MPSIKIPQPQHEDNLLETFNMKFATKT